MKSIMKKSSPLVFLLLFSKCLVASTYEFTLGGWSDGGYLSGQFETSFSAELDSFISTTEIVSFDANYTGLHTFSWSLHDLVYFGYSSSSNDVSFQLGSTLNAGGPYVGSPFSFTVNRYVAYLDNSEFSHTDEYMVIQEVSSVPIPAAAWLFGSGLISLIGFSRRKKHS